MECITKTRKVGGSLVVTLPREIVELQGIAQDELIAVDVKKLKRSYRGILKGILPFTKEDKLDIP